MADERERSRDDLHDEENRIVTDQTGGGSDLGAGYREEAEDPEDGRQLPGIGDVYRSGS
jgi:hypothetical protein